MNEKFYFNEVYKILWDIWNPTLSKVIKRLLEKEWTEEYNPTIGELVNWLLELWNFDEDMLYYQSDDVWKYIVDFLN